MITNVSTDLSSTNKVMKNTYGLLALTTGFSALMAFVNMSLMIKITPLIVLGLYFGLMFFTYKFKDSALGLVGAFAITGLLGFFNCYAFL